MSGTARAMEASIALQYNSGFQQSFVRTLEELGTGMLNDLKAFATAPREALIVGKENQGYMKSYTSKDFDGINRVVVSAANPLLNTTAGKLNLADQMAANGQLPQGEAGAMRYIEVMNTGRFEAETQALTSEYMAIQQDKEMLLSGKLPMIQLTDNHPLRMQEVNVLNNNPIIRSNPNLGQLVRQYIMAHFTQWTQMPPLLAAAMGIQPPPPQAAPPPGPQKPPSGPPQGPQGEPHPQGGAPTMAPKPAPQAPKMPTPPPNAPAQMRTNTMPPPPQAR